jgi:hypothetical protein
MSDMNNCSTTKNDYWLEPGTEQAFLLDKLYPTDWGVCLNHHYMDEHPYYDVVARRDHGLKQGELVILKLDKIIEHDTYLWRKWKVDKRKRRHLSTVGTS